jgi:hypothetical protein
MLPHLMSQKHQDYLKGVTKENSHTCTCGCVISNDPSTTYKHKRTLKHIVMSKGGTYQEACDLRYWRKRLAEMKEIEKHGGNKEYPLQKCREEIALFEKFVKRLEDKYINEDENIIEARKIMRGEI